MKFFKKSSIYQFFKILVIEIFVLIYMNFQWKKIVAYSATSPPLDETL
jgi:hypothetical protein